MSIEWICVGGPFGDCTSYYKGKIHNKLTVQNFINTELNPYEWGIIQINGQIICKYDRSRTLFDINNDLMRRYQEAEIKSIESSGGWSLMNYIITVEEPEIEWTQTVPYATFGDGFNF